MKNNDSGAIACGAVVVDKPEGWTSFDVVAKLRRIYGTRQVGHTGTLDPMATGVLVVLVGRAAKAAEYISAGRKVYRARLRLGITTDTEDITGTVLSARECAASIDEVRAAAEKFRGDIMQTPPMYSALKRGGEKLVDIARRGETVEREPRPVTVYSLDVSPTERADEYELLVSCSGGTYIRTLSADIGEALGCGGCMSALRRLETCGFSIGDAHTIEEIESSPRACIKDVGSLFADLPAVTVGRADEARLRNGQRLRLREEGSFLSGRVRLCGEDGFFALGEAADGSVRSVKLFVL